MEENNNALKLTLAMIVKDCEKDLPVVWQSVKHIVTEWIVVDTGSSDKTVEVAKSLGAKVFVEGDRFCDTLDSEQVKFFREHGGVDVKEGTKVFHFGRARTFSFEKATGDYILWLDSDDMLQGSLKMKEIILNNLDPKKPTGLHLLYQYEIDSVGNPITEHYRERVLPNTGKFNWVGRIHEIVIPEVESQYIRVAPSDTLVMHNITAEHRQQARHRNLYASLLDYYEQKQVDKVDPRTLYYLAQALRHENEDLAEKYYREYVEVSGWDEEQALACTKIADIRLMKEDNHTALEWAYRALRYKPDFPMCYATIAECYYAMEDLPSCELFCKHALDLEQPETLVTVNYKHNTFTPLLLLVLSYFKKGNVKECSRYVGRALKFEPQNALLLNISETCERAKQENDVAKAFKDIFTFMSEEGEILRMRNIFRNLPTALQEDPRLLQLKKKTESELQRNHSPIELTHEQFVLLAKAFKSRGAKTYHAIGMGEKTKAAFKEIEIVEAKSDARDADVALLIGNIDCVEDPVKFLQASAEWISKQGRIFLMSCPDPSRRVQALNTVALDAIVQKAGMTSWNVFRAEDIFFAEVLAQRHPSKTREVSIICGQSWEEWGVTSVATGIGGSEEAVIYLTRELAFLGMPITVYNTQNEFSVNEGVRWQHFTTLGQRDEHDIAILWRIPHHIEEYKLKAKNFYLWMHDVPKKEWFTDERVAKIDGIFALSEYHKSLLPKELQGKAIVTSNGIYPPQFKRDEIKRQARRLIYTSSYDRGLEHLLEIWPDVNKRFPDCELHIYYGWGTFDSLRKEEGWQRWKSKMLHLMETLPNVTEHGRIGQEELAKELLKSDIYVYPCHFPEISCISAMKAQVAGCIPLTTDFGALAETNLLSVTKVHGSAKDTEVRENFKKTLLGLLEEPLSEQERGIIVQKARQKFDWYNVAKQWIQILKGDRK